MLVWQSKPKTQLLKLCSLKVCYLKFHVNHIIVRRKYEKKGLINPNFMYGEFTCIKFALIKEHIFNSRDKHTYKTYDLLVLEICTL